MVLARHLRTDKDYALKILDKSFVVRHKLTDSIRLERKLLDELEYEGIVHLEFTFQDEQSLYLGLQCCPNGRDTLPQRFGHGTFAHASYLRTGR